MKVFNNNWSVGKYGYNQTQERKEGWLEGLVYTPQGFVRVYAQGDEKHYHITRLDFIREGRCYVRTFRGKRYTKRGVKTKAMQFAKEIAEA